ncbi:hypothetical protein AKJ16_DCAP14491 [Drosera capensis]
MLQIHHHRLTATLNHPSPLTATATATTTWRPPSPYHHFNFTIPSSHFITTTNCYAKPRRRPPDSNEERTREERRSEFDYEGNERRDWSGSRRRRRRKKRRWWDEEEEDGEEDWLGDVVEGLWVLKVLKSYGWTLPLIMLSWILATGPKAFVMALGVPFGLALITFSFNKLWEWTQNSRKPRPRPRRRQSSVYREDSYLKDDDEVGEESWNMRYPNKQNHFWVASQDDDNVDKRSASTFGGWEDLVGEPEVESNASAFSAERIDRSKSTTKKWNANRRVKRRDLPLLLRLLVGVFPFLGFWISLL